MTGSATAQTSDLPLTWRVHLARRQPGKLAGLLVTVVLLSAGAGVVLGTTWGALIAALALFGSTADFLLPVRYTLTADDATRDGMLNRTSISWRNVRRLQFDDEGVKLSPYAAPSPLEAYRGVYLRFDENEEAVREVLRRAGLDC